VAGCIYDPLTVDPLTHVRQAFLQHIPANRLNPVAQNMLAFYLRPIPRQCFNYTVVGSPRTPTLIGTPGGPRFKANWHSFLKVSTLMPQGAADDITTKLRKVLTVRALQCVDRGLQQHLHFRQLY